MSPQLSSVPLFALATRRLKIEKINKDCQSFYQARLNRLRD
jgi:hypothetical protein